MRARARCLSGRALHGSLRRALLRLVNCFERDGRDSERHGERRGGRCGVRLTPSHGRLTLLKAVRPCARRSPLRVAQWVARSAALRAMEAGGAAGYAAGSSADGGSKGTSAQTSDYFETKFKIEYSSSRKCLCARARSVVGRSRMLGFLIA